MNRWLLQKCWIRTKKAFAHIVKSNFWPTLLGAMVPWAINAFTFGRVNVFGLLRLELVLVTFGTLGLLLAIFYRRYKSVPPDAPSPTAASNQWLIW